jgi:hypothetical protein
MIETIGLTKRYGSAVAVDNLSLHVSEGELGREPTVLVKSLPVRDPDEPVIFQGLRTDDAMVARYSGYGRPGPAAGVGIRTSFSMLTFERFRDHARSLANIFAVVRITDLPVARLSQRRPDDAGFSAWWPPARADWTIRARVVRRHASHQ